MTKTEACAIRARQLQGEPVLALELQQALEVLKRTRAGRPYKYKLPPLPRPVQEMADATLCFNLGRAIRG